VTIEEPEFVHPITRALQLRLLAHPLTGIEGLSDSERDILRAAALVIENFVMVEARDERAAALDRLEKAKIAFAKGVMTLDEARGWYLQ
jgi:hypothetical protein